jgi:multisubunit Na+/H+ antiporter MnhF subunit
MTAWALAALILLASGLAPALWLAAQGDEVNRLVGLELAASITVLILLLLTQAYGPSSAVIVPLTLTLLSLAGGLVFVRLLRTR